MWTAIDLPSGDQSYGLHEVFVSFINTLGVGTADPERLTTRHSSLLPTFHEYANCFPSFEKA
jgi:hypothetical protein